MEWVDHPVPDQRITNAYRLLERAQDELIGALDTRSGTSHRRAVLATLASVTAAKTSLRGAEGGADNGRLEASSGVPG